MIRWDGSDVVLHSDASVDVDADVVSGLRGVRVVFPQPWVASPAAISDEGVEQVWTFSSDGASVSALVTHTFVSSWAMSVVITNDSPVAVSVPLCEVVFEADWPTVVWLAGASGFVVGPPAPDGRVLALRQLRGSSRLSEGRRWVADLPVVLGPGATGASQYRVHWRGEWLAHHREVATLLPAWWPERTALESGDLLPLRLPDAAITAAGVHLIEEDDLVWLTARDGRHLAQVHSGVGSQDVHLWWAPSLPFELTQRVEPVVTADPRLATGVDAWLVARALAWGVARDQRTAREWLQAASEELAARPRCADVLTAAAVTQASAILHDADLFDVAVEWTDALPVQPGLPRLVVSLHIAGLSLGLDGPRRRPGVPVDPVERALVAVETACLSGTPTPTGEAWLVGSLLGAGLPGETTDHLTRARACSALALAPESWDFTTRWPASLPVVIEDAHRRLLAEGCDDEAFAWLLWDD